MLINYPVLKVAANRCFHLLLNVLLHKKVRDISNNLKLIRSGILKSITIEENNFAANVETGLKPIVAGYNIQEVPISWINRTLDMGVSSFRLLKVAPQYAWALVKIVRRAWRVSSRRVSQQPGTLPAARQRQISSL